MSPVLEVPSTIEKERNNVSVDWEKASEEVTQNFASKLKAQVKKNAQRAKRV